jgi:hypothetical protein
MAPMTSDSWVQLLARVLVIIDKILEGLGWPPVL